MVEIAVDCEFLEGTLHKPGMYAMDASFWRSQRCMQVHFLQLCQRQMLLMMMAFYRQNWEAGIYK